jgi:XTP/dITP diphosphohydrolase
MRKLSKIYFVTGNKGKLKEAEAILDFKLKSVTLDLNEIQSLDIKEVVKQKALDAFDVLQKPLIVDDGGVYFEAWNGFPGPLVKYIDEAGGVDLILKMLKGERNRNILLRSAVGYHDGKRVHAFVGEIKAKIAKIPRGSNGWSWDCIFIPEPYKYTFAELTEKEKSLVSHRKMAFEKLKSYINEKKRRF